MRKILCVVSISAVVLLLASVRAASKEEEEAKVMIKSMAGDCIEKWNATEADVNEMLEKKLPSTRNGKCLSYCMMNQMNDDAEFQPDECLELVKMGCDNETLIEKITKVFNKCAKPKDPDTDICDNTFLVMKCMQDGAKEEGFEM